MTKRSFIILLLVLATLFLGAQTGQRYKTLNFDNPGTKRILKTEAGNHFYFRSLPEKSLLLNTTGISKLELRSFSNQPARKPELIIVIGKQRTSYPLVPARMIGSYQVYTPLSLEIPANTKEVQILCYDRSYYFRAYNVLPPKPPKKIKLKNLEIKAHAGAMTVHHNGSSSDYLSLLPAQPMKFTLNNGRDAYIYVRPRLLDRSTPKLGVFVNGDLIETLEFSIKRTTKYHVQGINNLGISKKITLPDNKGTSEIELRALSEHLFLAKPVLIKKK
jgi:hypothetical protein